MIAILSPAKNMTQVSLEGLSLTTPSYEEQTCRLAAALKELTPWQLESAMKISPQLAWKAAGYYESFRWGEGGSPALLSYWGLAYQHLDGRSFSLEQLELAQDRLRILSALYGLLRPLDAILPYRLEMGTKWKPDGKTSLYAFWGDRLYRDLFALGQPVICLASGEYAKAITPYLKPSDPWVVCDFMVRRRGKLTTLATEAKMARGEMARAIVTRGWRQPEQLWEFDWNGYHFSPELSSESRYRFIQE